MTYQMKPLLCEPTGLSEKLIASHYENNYGGAVKRLNAITTDLAAMDGCGDSPSVCAQRAQTRRTDRFELHDSAWGVFPQPWWRWPAGSEGVVGANAHTLAVDPASHEIYLPLKNVDHRFVIWVMTP